jgi:hypothetical protein
MKNARKVTAVLMLTLLVFAVWPLAGRTQQERGQAVSSAESAPPQGSPLARRETPMSHRAMSVEEKLVRDVYARLMRYQSAALDELASREGKESEPENYLTFELRDIRSGAAADIWNRPRTEFVTERGGALVSLKPTHLSRGNGPVYAYYEAQWTDSYGVAEGAKTVGQALRQDGWSLENINRYTSYEVTVHLNGKQRTYRALALYQLQSSADGGSQGEQRQAARPARAEILDNITPGMSAVYSDESSLARAPWKRYVKTGSYLAVARAIKQSKDAGISLIPADAPIGYLPGDGATAGTAEMQAMTAEACQQPPTVASLQASLPSTQNAVTHAAPAAGVFTTTNTSTAFATATSSDLMVVFQGSGMITVTAMGVSPSTAASQLRWTMQRDPNDSIDFGLPTLSAQTGASITFTPTLTGNFILICYYDTNGDSMYNAGEELRVLRMASVNVQVQPNSFIRTNANFVGGSNSVNVQNAMELQMDVLLEGGGADALIGVDRVTLGNVGNLRTDNFVVNYPVPTPAPPAPGNVNGTGSENPGAATPVVDTVNVTQGHEPTGGTTPFRGNSQDTSLGAGPGGLGQLRRVHSLDAPGFGWEYLHPTTQNPWATTVNGNAFREFIVGFSSTFPRNYVVIAVGNWTVVANGTNVSAMWTSSGASVVIPGASGSSAALTSTVSSSFSPQTGDAAGVQVLGLSFVREFRMDYTP